MHVDCSAPQSSICLTQFTNDNKINYEAVVSIKKKKIENWKLRSKSKTCFDSPREREREGVWLLWGCGCGWYNFVRNEGVRTEKELVFVVMMKQRKRLKRGGGGGFASETRTGAGGQNETKRKNKHTASAPVSVVMNHDLPAPPLFLMSFLPAL